MQQNKSEISRKILSDITTYSKYAKYLDNNKRRETWEETVLRNAAMHAKKYPTLENEIYSNFSYVLNKQVLPSMRSLQFGGKPIELMPSRLFNCSFMAIDDIACFSECMFLLLGGSGVGFSVQQHHISKLPEVIGPKSRTRRYLSGRLHSIEKQPVYLE